MRAELVLMGRRVDMAPRAHRRALVVLIYAGLTLLMAGLYLADGWRTSGYYLVFATILVNRLFLGGYDFGGLIKPFNGKAPRRSSAPSYLLLALRIYRPEPSESEYRNDEREVARRGQAHYQSYGVVVVMLTLVWLLAGWSAFKPQMLGWFPGSPQVLIYALVLGGLVLMFTLPQAILLWTEPDMEAEDLES